DTVFYGMGTVGMVYYDSDVSEMFTTTEGRYSNNILQDLLNQGTDGLETVTNYSHQNDVEVFASLRMNDTHDYTGDRLLYAWPEVKNNPGWIMGDDPAPSYGRWSAFDFGVQGVRDLVLDICEEMSTNYDIDGIELDFFRHPFFFRSHAFGGTATAADCELMTQLIRDIRTMTEQVGLQRERPVLVSIRVPDSMGYNLDVGLDVEQWLDEGLVDAMTVTGYFRAEEWSESVALGDQYDLPVYACISESRMSGAAGELRNTNESYHARASMALEQGVDGVCLFNFFDGQDELWNVLGEEATLQGQNKIYTTGARGVSYLYSNVPNGGQYLDRVVISPEKKLILQQHQTHSVPMAIGDDLTGLDSSDVRVQLRLSLDSVPAQDVGAYLKINGAPVYLGTPTVAGNYLDFSIDPSLLAKGDNEFLIYSWANTGSAVLNDFQLFINYRPTGNAAPFVYDPFHVASPADPAKGEYAAGPLLGTNPSPSTTGFTGDWTTGHGTETTRFETVAAGLEYDGLETKPGAVRFVSDTTITDLQSVTREFTTDAYTADAKDFYMTGLISFDEDFSTDAGSFAMIGMLNAEEGDTSVPWTIGLQWGLMGNGDGGVDAVVRYREAGSPNPIVTTVIAEDVTPGEHLFMLRVQVDQDSSTDYLSAWFDPIDVWAASATTLFINDAACWLMPTVTPDPTRLVDTLILGVNDIGDSTVFFDEIRLGTNLNDLFLPLAEDLPGDANRDGVVNASDATILAGNWQATNASWEMGDFNGDGIVNASDATILAGNWQASTNTAVPEPSTIVLLFLGALALAVRFLVKK
ncbi:MAG: dockerin type I domain-containing protein, partial [Planctomycetia bacterium]